ncbi:NUDIX hydrolase family protein [Heterostelium album PN500]|uniref:NUDIX hydrolase family protein n=1 Tax=Heterostelium pallidum (strain ATCC 26659 / Pp 5 / PN500) TaxID=670386 RepID=D3B9F0_HETP5|nr:NUDIX hydrolase family protein [Heterostelium album PN500]EFA81862.1 NUDIX hydrolase family protein [Heterostelium album PN500]|eukprot:XP_020433979.1 NUDIX hydrolase family protein [Heterostelium album PN500]
MENNNNGDKKLFRKCVGAVVFNEEGNLLVGRRSSLKKAAVGKWQFPQGGVEKDEDYYNAVLRELKEEVGLELSGDYSLKYIDRLQSPIEYLYERIETSHDRKTHGQSIVWYFFYMNSKHIDRVKLDNEPEQQEFDQVQWMSFDDLLQPENIVSFKLEMYQQLQKQSIPIIQNAAK